MAELVDGAYLNQYLAPQLLKEFRNYKDDFIGLLGKPNKAALSADGIKFNKLINNVEFLTNNADGFTPTKMNFKKTLVEWDKHDTTPTEVDDAEVRYLATDKRSQVRMKHSEAWKIGMRNYVMQKLAPQADTNGMPVLRTTGDVVNGRRRLTYADMINFWAAVENLNLNDKSGFNLILCNEHKTDLIQDRASVHNYRDIRIDTKTGKLIGFYTLKLHENNYNPKYDGGGNLKAIGAAAINTDKNASTLFYAPNTVHHIEKVKVIYKPEHLDTRSADPTSEFRLQSYGLTDKVQNYGFGALVSGNE